MSVVPSAEVLEGEPLVHRQQVRVEWGHCDPARIVFYPNYFAWFDQCTQGLLRAVGLDQEEIARRYGVIGTPLADAQARFRSPATFGDLLDAETFVSRWGRASFTIAHTLAKNGRTVVEGTEVRVWAGQDPDDPCALKALPIPHDFRELFGYGA
ncbi:MAG TPA: thioesterase family protein [Alphaproteobacteria bacterium]|nr:thioesterase family protein [Alphaproteobacteria bacterium]